MTKVLIGSRNRVKIEAVKEAFSRYFKEIEVKGIDVSSKISNQPIGEETFQGAKNRAFELERLANKKKLNVNFFVGIEGGVLELFSIWFAFGAVCILAKNNQIGYGTTPLFELPEDITKKLLDGIELGNVIDELVVKNNTKEKKGAVGYFTKGIMDRKQFYIDGLIMALIPFVNEGSYFKG